MRLQNAAVIVYIKFEHSEESLNAMNKCNNGYIVSIVFIAPLSQNWKSWSSKNMCVGLKFKVSPFE